jgi:hypothetical protein
LIVKFAGVAGTAIYFLSRVAGEVGGFMSYALPSLFTLGYSPWIRMLESLRYVVRLIVDPFVGAVITPASKHARMMYPPPLEG